MGVGIRPLTLKITSQFFAERFVRFNKCKYQSESLNETN